jgi:hypothetical protein
MCDPGTAAALYLGGGLLQGVGDYQQGEAAANLAKQDEALANFRAKDVIDVAKLDIGDFKRKVAALIGSQRVAYVSQGLLPDSDTPAAVAADTAHTANIDEQRIMLNAIRERFLLKVQASDFSDQAAAAHKAGIAGAIGSVFGSAASAAGAYVK